MKIQRSSVVAFLLLCVSIALLAVAQSWSERILAILAVALLALQRFQMITFSRALQSIKSGFVAFQQEVRENHGSTQSRMDGIEAALKALQDRPATMIQPAPVVVQRFGASWRAVAGVALVLFSIQLVMLAAGLRYVGSVERGLNFLRSQVTEVSSLSGQTLDAATESFEMPIKDGNTTAQIEAVRMSPGALVSCQGNRCSAGSPAPQALAAPLDPAQAAAADPTLEQFELRARLADAPEPEEGIAHAAER